jgi:hypothetical protein
MWWCHHFIEEPGGIASGDLGSGAVGVCIWIAYGFPMGSRGIAYEILWIVNGFPMA